MWSNLTKGNTRAVEDAKTWYGDTAKFGLWIKIRSFFGYNPRPESGYLEDGAFEYPTAIGGDKFWKIFKPENCVE